MNQNLKHKKLAMQLALVGLASLALPAFAADSVTAPVVVTGTRIEQNSFDLPMSINAISGDVIRDAQQQVNHPQREVRILAGAATL